MYVCSTQHTTWWDCLCMHGWYIKFVLVGGDPPTVHNMPLGYAVSRRAVDFALILVWMKFS